MCGNVKTTFETNDDGEPLAACTKCWRFVKACCPNQDCFEICDEKDQDEILAAQIDEGRALHSKEETEDPHIPSNAPPLELMSTGEIEYYLKEEFHAYTHQEVASKYGKTPAALRLRPVKLLQHSLKGKSSKQPMRVFYPIRPQNAKRKLVLFTKNGLQLLEIQGSTP